MTENELNEMIKGKFKMPSSFHKLIDELIEALEINVGENTPSNHKFKDLGNHYELELPFPGYPKEELRVTEKEGYLIVKATPSVLGRRPVNLNIPLIQYRYSQVTAKMENGLLTIKLHKQKIDAVNKVEIK